MFIIDGIGWVRDFLQMNNFQFIFSMVPWSLVFLWVAKWVYINYDWASKLIRLMAFLKIVFKRSMVAVICLVIILGALHATGIYTFSEMEIYVAGL